MVNKPDFPSPGQSPGAYTLSYGYSTEVSKFVLIKVDSLGVVQVNGTIASGTLTANLGTTDTAALAAVRADLDSVVANQAAELQLYRDLLAAQRASFAEAQSLRQTIAANAGGFIPMPEMFTLGAL